MSITIAEARDTAMGVIDAALKADGATDAIPIHYDNVAKDKPADTSYVVMTVRNLSSPQSTQGTRRWLSTGAFTVQVFATMGDGNLEGDTIAQVIMDAFRTHTGSADGIWFFDMASNEIGPSGGFFQTNVSSSFRYQQQVPA